MIVTLRKFSERLQKEEFVQFDIPAGMAEIYVKIQTIRGIDMSDSPSAYGQVCFRYKGNDLSNGMKIYDFNGYSN